MMRFGCGSHVTGHGHGHRHNGGRPDTSPSGSGGRWAPPAEDIDPVCGMTVETAVSKSSVYDGHVYYFCSQDCREKFEASPRTYMNTAASSPHTMEQSHEHQH
jgi:YHS domain-containing protein